ncbi:MAG: hypothetical protein ACHQZR_07990 [Candidatus Limnocylindrales bacterium]
MRVRRGLLFWGLFLIPFGAIPLLVRAGLFDAGAAGDILPLWPLALIAVGLVLLVSRTRVALAGTAVVAIVLGSLAGTAVASGPAWVGSAVGCRQADSMAADLDRTGTFDGPATVALALRCGSVALTTRGGSDWQVSAAHAAPAPTILASGTQLSVTSPAENDGRQQTWSIAAPADRLDMLQLTATATSATFHLDGAHLTQLSAHLDAGDLLIDAGAATITRLDVSVDAGRARIALGPGGATSGRIAVDIGAIDLCVPADVDLRLTVNEDVTFVTNLARQGLTDEGGVWRRFGAPGAPTIELTITGDVANLTLDPQGGCR